MTNKLVFTFAVLATALFGCSTTPPEFQEGPDVELSFDGLTPMTGTTMDLVWARTDIDLKGYSKIMFEGVGVEYRPVTGPYSGRAGMSSSRRAGSQTEFQLDEATKALFEEAIASAFLDALSSSSILTVVEEPGPDVLLIRAALHDVVSEVPPELSGRGDIFISSVGQATLILEIRDSESNAIFARGIDRRAMDRSGTMMRSSRATNRSEVRRLGSNWGNMLRTALETLTTEGAGT